VNSQYLGGESSKHLTQTTDSW